MSKDLSGKDMGDMGKRCRLTTSARRNATKKRVGSTSAEPASRDARMRVN